MAVRRLFQMGAVALVLGLLSVGFAVSAADAPLTMSGSTTVLPIAQAVAEHFAGTYDIEVTGGGSGVGIANLLAGTTIIADHSRMITNTEYAQGVTSNVFPFTFWIANDAVAPIVNPANPITNITIAQLNDIWMGNITNWKQLGGDDKPIVVVSRDTTSGTYATWQELVLNKKTMTVPAIFTSSNADVANEVASNPDAIGYVGLGYLTSAVKALTVNGIAPSVETAIDKTFPIDRPLFMSTNGFPTGVALTVISWILSDEGQKLVLDSGFAPVRRIPGM